MGELEHTGFVVGLHWSMQFARNGPAELKTVLDNEYDPLGALLLPAYGPSTKLFCETLRACPTQTQTSSLS